MITRRLEIAEMAKSAQVAAYRLAELFGIVGVRQGGRMVGDGGGVGEGDPA